MKPRRPVPPEPGVGIEAVADRVLRKVAAANRMTVAELLRPRRKKAAPSHARQTAMALLRRKTTLTLREIGVLLGGVSDAAVAMGVRSVEDSRSAPGASPISNVRYDRQGYLEADPGLLLVSS